MMEINGSMNGDIYCTYSSVKWNFDNFLICLVIMRNYLAAYKPSICMRAYLVRLETLDISFV